jgi:hypothetical protein
MEEFSSRVDAQRQLVQAVNSHNWSHEQLFALTEKAIQRWSAVNHIDPISPLMQLLRAASLQVFIMANHSDDPITGTYVLSRKRVQSIEAELRAELRNISMPSPGDSVY